MYGLHAVFIWVYQLCTLWMPPRAICLLMLLDCISSGWYFRSIYIGYHYVGPVLFVSSLLFLLRSLFFLAVYALHFVFDLCVSSYRVPLSLHVPSFLSSRRLLSKNIAIDVALISKHILCDWKFAVCRALWSRSCSLQINKQFFFLVLASLLHRWADVFWRKFSRNVWSTFWRNSVWSFDSSTMRPYNRHLYPNHWERAIGCVQL